MKKLIKLFLLGLFCFVLISPAYASEESEKGKEDSDHKVPDSWENPIQNASDYKTYMEKIDAVTKKDTCYDLMKVRSDLFAYEIRYWKAIVAVDTDAYSELETVQIHLQDLRLKMAMNRSKLEIIKGTYESCVEGEKTEFLQDEYTHLKEKLHWIGYQADTNDQASITDDDAANKCSKAEEMLSETQLKIANYEEDIQEITLAGKVEELYNAKEILNVAKENFAYASKLNITASTNNNEILKMRNCMGIISECNIAMELIRNAKKYSNEKSKDKSSDIDQLDAKLKLYIDILGDKKAYTLNLDNNDEIRLILEEISEKLKYIAKEIASIKYDASDNLDAFDTIKSNFELVDVLLSEYDDALKSTTKDNLSKAQKKNKTAKLIKKARLQSKSLKSKVKKTDNNANTDEEENVVKFVDQGAAYDAVTARKTANAYKNQKKYNDALANAYAAIETIKIAKDVLTKVN